MQVPKNFVPDPFDYHQELELTVERLTNLGLGVGRVDGWVVMVPYVIPGERVKVRVFRNFQNYSDADLVEVLEASPDRVEPGCPLYQCCGGPDRIAQGWPIERGRDPVARCRSSPTLFDL